MNNRLNIYSDENTLQTVALTDTFTLERYTQFARYLASDKIQILDVGCADGRGGARLKHLMPQISLAGLDCVVERLNALPPEYASKVHGLTNSIPANGLSYDAIVAGEFLEHLYPADVDATLCEFHRILKIGGQLLMTTPNPYSLKMRLRQDTVYGVSHLTQHFPKLLKLRLMMHGFNHVRLIGSGKATRYFGERCPWLSVYGSYLIIASKI